MKRASRNVLPVPKRTSRKKRKTESHVLMFRSLKKQLFGHPQKKSLDLLDQWILKKRMMSLFF
jgi:hypothetical protein